MTLPKRDRYETTEFSGFVFPQTVENNPRLYHFPQTNIGKCICDESQVRLRISTSSFSHFFKSIVELVCWMFLRCFITCLEIPNMGFNDAVFESDWRQKIQMGSEMTRIAYESNFLIFAPEILVS